MLISVVVPIYNEEENIVTLGERLVASLSQYRFEIIFVNDGSKDKSLALLQDLLRRFPGIIRILDFQRNFGQHMAIMAGFEYACGDIVVTLDADLQNPPEEIPALLKKIEEGHDYVGSYRKNRQDNYFREYASRFINWVRKTITDIEMKDHGCMLRAYRKDVVKRIIEAQERSTFIPALAYKLSIHPTEIAVEHAARSAGTSKYNLYGLIRLHFDLMTGFSLVPLQIFTLLGLFASFLSAFLFIVLIIRRFILGSEAEGVFTLFAILFFLLSLLIVGVGFIGEYLGRISLSLSKRPRYMIRKIFKN